MRRRTLRGRLNIVLLQWFVVLALVTGAVLVLSFPRIRRNLVDDRLLLAQTIARALDATVSGALQEMGRLSTDLPDPGGATAARLHTFRFQQPFGEASYLLDGDYGLIAADPPQIHPLTAPWLGAHEAVTPLVRKNGSGGHPVVAIVQPFQRGLAKYYLVSELNPLRSTINTFLSDLTIGRGIHVAVIDDTGTILASPEPQQLLHTLPDGQAYGDRIRAHRPHVTEGGPSQFDVDSEGPAAALTVMAPLRFAPWGVIVEQRNALAFSGLYRGWWGLAVSCLALAGFAALFSRTLSRSVVRPIQQLSRQAAAMRGGDLSSAIAVSGDYEVQVLASTLDDTRRKLHSSLEQLHALNDSLERQVAERTQTIEAKNTQTQMLVRRLLTATEDERRRLARELHDEIAQLLTVIQLSLHRVDADTPEMQRAKSLLVKTQEDIHRIIHDLRPSLLDDLGLREALESYANDNLVRQGIAVSLEIDERVQARPEVEITMFRIYQEVVTNILRHALAEHVSVELYERDGKLVLDVEDDGRGFDPDAKSDGSGLTGMRERAALVNGTVRFDSEPGAGTHIAVEIPLQ